MSQAYFDLKETAQKVKKALGNLKDVSTAFSSQTGIGCKTGCGACCAKANGVWATPAEMLPMAFQMFDEGTSSAALKSILDSGQHGQCMAYETSDPSGQLGRCRRYEVRPSVCILFGSGLRPTKNGGYEFIGCSWQRQIFASEIGHVEHDASGDSHEPRMLTANIRSISPDPKLALEAPVNVALLEALELIEFHHQFASFEGAVEESIEEPIEGTMPIPYQELTASDSERSLILL